MTITEFIEGFAEEPGYFDHARIAPVSARVSAEMHAYDELVRRMRFGSLTQFDHEVARARNAVSALIAFPPERIAFQANSSVALQTVMLGAEGGVLVSRDEFPSGPLAVQRASATTGRVFPVWLDEVVPGADGHRVDAQSVRGGLLDGVGAVLVGHVDYLTGYRTDLAAIREVIGDRLLIVNASQAFGAIDERYEMADIVVSNGFKWVRAGYDTGFIALSERALDRIRPSLAGFADRDDVLPLDELPEPTGTAADFVTGPVNPGAAARFATALEDIAAVGLDVIESVVLERADAVITAARQVGLPTVNATTVAGRTSGIESVAPPLEHLGALAVALHNHGVSSTKLGSVIRLSPHVSTDEESFEMLRAAFGAWSRAVHT